MNHPERLSIKQKTGLLAYLKNFISDNKNELFSKIIKNRTKFITIVLEDIFQPHNASAVLRSCDCFGIQDVHIIENKNVYNVNPDVALGASKWLTVVKYNSSDNNTAGCLNTLKEQGYRIVATTPHESGKKLQDFDLSNKIALLFGTELEGLSDIALEKADEYLYIPMHGFTESLNISVSAALAMFYLTDKMRDSNVDWQLSESEEFDIQINWARSVIKECHKIEKEFFARSL